MAKEKRSIARLTPGAMEVTVGGNTVRVAANALENKIMNMIMASQLRDLLQENIKKYKDKDALLTPKELGELSKAAADIAKFSGEVYQGDAISDTSEEKSATPAGEVPDVDFDTIAEETKE